MHNRSPAMSTGLDDLVMLYLNVAGLFDFEETI